MTRFDALMVNLSIEKATGETNQKTRWTRTDPDQHTMLQSDNTVQSLFNFIHSKGCLKSLSFLNATRQKNQHQSEQRIIEWALFLVKLELELITLHLSLKIIWLIFYNRKHERLRAKFWISSVKNLPKTRSFDTKISRISHNFRASIFLKLQ